MTPYHIATFKIEKDHTRVKIKLLSHRIQNTKQFADI